MMRENKKYTIKRLVLTVATMIILAGMLRGNTMKAYSQELEVIPGGSGGVESQSSIDYWNNYNQNLSQANPGYTVITPGGTYVNGQAVNSTPAQQAVTPTQQAAPEQPKPKPTQAPKKETPKEKLNVYFTDMYGHVIYTVQVTKGTTVGKTQFPKEVKDIRTREGEYTFDKWDYDGRKVEHELIIRALYNLKQ